MKYYEMSPYQKNIMDIEKSCPGTAIGNIGGLVIWKEKPDFEKMQQVYTLFCQYHRAIRLQLHRNGMLYEAECPEQVMDYVDRREGNEKRVREEAKKWFREPFPLLDSPLYQLKYFDLGDKCLLGVKLHHLIADGAVIAHMERWQEMDSQQWQQYTGKSEEEYLEQMEQRSFLSASLQKRAKEYFTSVIPQGEYPWLLKTSSKNPEAKRIKIPWSEKDIKNFKEYGKKNHLTIENMIFAALSIFIGTVKDTKQVAIGRVVANRTKKQMDCVGIYANTLPVFMDLQENIPFAELCHYCAKQAYQALRYGSYSYHQLMMDCQLKQNVYDVSVSYRNLGLMPVGEKSYGEELFCGYSERGIRLFINEWENRYELQVQYRVEEYSEIQIKQFGESLAYIIRQGIDGKIVKDIEIVTEEERKRIQKLHAVTPVTAEKNEGNRCSILKEIEKHVQKAPHKICVGMDSAFFTYSQIWQMATEVQKELETLGMKEGGKVLVHMSRSKMLLPALLGVLLSGGAFLMVPKEQNTEWVKRVKGNCDYIIKENEDEGKRQEKGFSVQKINNERPRKKGIAYYIFTSGTTGMPKAVMISRRSLYIRLKWMEREYGCEKWTLQKTNLTFDVSVWELFLPLITGNSVYLLKQGDEKRPERIGKVIEEQKIGLLHFVPSMLHAFCQYAMKEGRKFPEVKRVICSGEVLPVGVSNMAFSIFPNAEICNFYGPAECTIDVSHTSVKPGKPITIGKPVANTAIYICNAERKLLPTGWMGEICIVGDLVGEGYENERQQGRFSKAGKKHKNEKKQSGFLEINGEKAYFTGDYGMLREDGNVIYMGRRDSQYKLRGMRIDTGIIERLLLDIPQVKQAAVLVINEQLIAYYSAECQIKHMNRKLRAYLPGHQLPQVYIWMKQLPVTSNGKVDKEALKKYGQEKDCTLGRETGKGMEQQRNQHRVKDDRRTGNGSGKRKKSGQIDSVSGKREGNGQTNRNLKLENILYKTIRKFAILSTDEEETLCERGLDSLSILQILEDLQSKRINVEYEDFLKARNVRELARIIEKRQSKSYSEKKTLLWFAERKKKTLLLGVPYGGGDGGAYYKLSRHLERKIDVAALSDGCKKEGVIVTAQNIVKELQHKERQTKWEYECYYIMGICVGSAIAIEIASALEQMEKRVVLILGAALVQRGIPFRNRVLSYWDFMTDKQVKRCINSIQQKKFPVPDGMVQNFRGDVNRYLLYMNQTKSRKFRGECYVIFGKKDKFLKGYKKKKKKWEAFLERDGKEIHYLRIERGGHFFVGENARVTAGVIGKIFSFMNA